ncbi:uncharacterized protein L969DRAFT_47677, partial [Mixia osmundae IAM 14324]
LEAGKQLYSAGRGRRLGKSEHSSLARSSDSSSGVPRLGGYARAGVLFVPASASYLLIPLAELQSRETTRPVKTA